MKIVFAASEVTPFAKTGGLADVCASLPIALRRLGHDVRIAMPFYRSVEKGGHGIRKGRKSIEVPLAGSVKKGLLRWTELEGIPVYLIDNPEYYGREFLYGPPGGDYPDNPSRFGFFCHGLLHLLRKLDFRPDIIHCNDWQTALIPVLLRHLLADDPFFEHTCSVLTIHNLAFQGIFGHEHLVDLGLPESLFTIDRLEYYNRINLMKGGILSADLITTVSPTYREEILTSEAGCGLDGVLSSRRDSLSGILNGIDVDEWRPETDSHLVKNYSLTAPGAKSASKKALQKELGLPVEDVPLFGMVSRLTEQKGIGLLLDVLPRLLAKNVQLAIIGDGDESLLRALSAFPSQQVQVVPGFHPELAHRVYAGTDIFLMPSRFEPCGLGQMIALRYGSIPVVRQTGGLADTVTDAGEKGGTGFTFQDYSGDALWTALDRALKSYQDRNLWKKLMRRGMTCDFSWAKSALRYDDLYRGALAAKSG